MRRGAFRSGDLTPQASRLKPPEVSVKRPTAVVSRSRGADAAAQRLETDLTRRLTEEWGLDVLEVPHLYDLAEDDPALDALRGVNGPLLVFAWLYPRATRWTLSYQGVTAKAEAVDLRGLASAEDALAAARPPARRGKGVRYFFPATADGHFRGQGRRKKAPDTFSPPERWYPVIDYDRCRGCLDCVEFCLFGVYAVEREDRPRVEAPDRCKPGCPACARVCPAGAIIFPHHLRTPAIAGADEGEIEPLSEEVLERDRIAQECADAAARYLGRLEPGRAPAARDRLDDAIDQLDDSEV